MDSIFIQLAIVLGLASILGFLTQLVKLPILVAYILVGLLIAVLRIPVFGTSSNLSFLSEVGIALVMFLVGMELDLRELKTLGKPIIAVGLLQTAVTGFLGFFIAQFFGFSNLESIYLGLGLSFSSTIVIVKILTEKKELNSLSGKLSLGITLLQDIIAVFILLAITAGPSILNLGLSKYFPILDIVSKGILLFVLTLGLSKYILPKIFEAISDSPELLFLSSLSLLFIYVSASLLLGFSVVIGAFLAGIALASSPYHLQIQSKVKPLRDFFVSLFFVYLGTQVNISQVGSLAPIILIFTIFAILIKPIIFLILLGIFGFRKHTMFQVGLLQSQISEFSLIIALIGLKNGSTSSSMLTTVALILLLSTISSAIISSYSNKIFKIFRGFVGIFERRNYKHALESIQSVSDIKDHVVVIGGHRVGGDIVRFLKEEKIPQIVLDFNPDQVRKLLEEHIPVVYGDMSDPEVLEALNLTSARMVISTAPSLSDNKLLLEELSEIRKTIPVIIRAESVADAKVLYKAGADYVIIPEILAGDNFVEKLKDNLGSRQYWQDRSKIEIEKLNRKPLST